MIIIINISHKTVQTREVLEEAAMRWCWVKQMSSSCLKQNSRRCLWEAMPVLVQARGEQHSTSFPMRTGSEEREMETVKQGGQRVCPFPSRQEGRACQPPAFKGGKWKIREASFPCSPQPQTELCARSRPGRTTTSCGPGGRGQPRGHPPTPALPG